MVRNYPRADLFNCTFVDNTVNTFSYAVGDGFAHAIEGGEWTPENQCSLVNCVFWGTGNDVQAHSEGVGGMALVSHVAAQLGQLVLGPRTRGAGVARPPIRSSRWSNPYPAARARR